MLKIVGVNVFGVLLGVVVMYFVGFIWYGFLFIELWMNVNGLFFIDDVKIVMQWLIVDGVQMLVVDVGLNMMVMLWGFVLLLVLSFGFVWYMVQKNILKFLIVVLFGFWFGFLIGVLFMVYDMVYMLFGFLMGLFVDGSYIVVMFVVVCVVILLFD